LEQRLIILDRERNHDTKVSQSFVDTLEIEMDALNRKLKTQNATMHLQEETLNRLRGELKKKSWNIEQLTTENSKMKSTVERLEEQSKISETQEEEIRRLKEANERFRVEIKQVQMENMDLENRLKEQKEFIQEMEARVNDMENSNKDNKSNKSKIDYEAMNQELKLERLMNQVTKLRQDLEIAEEKSQDHRSQLHEAQKAVLKCQLEKDESILVLKREHSAKLLENENYQNALLKQKTRKLQELESDKAILEAKYAALGTQLTILETSNKKTSEIQNTTIQNLEEALKKTQDKLSKAKEKMQHQSEIAETTRIRHRKYQEKLEVQDNELIVKKGELENKATLEDTIERLQKKLHDLEDKNSRIELENGQMQLRLRSSDDQLNIMNEQRTRTFRFQQETIEQHEKQIEEMRKRNRVLGEKLTESEMRWSKQSNIRSKSETKNQTKSTENSELKGSNTSDGNTYKELWEIEKEERVSLTAQVTQLKKRNKDGGKAYKKLLKRNEELEAKWKRVCRVRDQMNKALEKILRSLERELDQFKAELQLKEKNSADWNMINSSIKKLQKMYETWGNTQRELNLEETSLPRRQKIGRVRSGPDAQSRMQHKESPSKEMKSSPQLEPNQGRQSLRHTEEKEPHISGDLENTVKILKQKLNVEKELSLFQRALEQLKLERQNKMSKEVSDNIVRLWGDLEHTSSRIAATREEVAVTLKKWQQNKSEVFLQIEMLKQSSPGLKSNLDTRLDSALNDLRSRLEEKSSKLSQNKRAKLESEFENLKKKKKHFDRKSKELKTLEYRLNCISNAIKELTTSSEQAIKKRLLISSLLSECKSMKSSQLLTPNVNLRANHRSSVTAIRNPKTCCPYCSVQNTVNVVEHAEPSFFVNCWKCQEVFFVEKSGPSRSSFIAKIPGASAYDISSCKRGQRATPVVLLPRISNIMYSKIRIKGLTSSIRNNPQHLRSFYKAVFSGREIDSQNFLYNAVEISLDSPVTTSQISDMQKKIKLLHSGEQKDSLFIDQLDQVTIQGISNSNDLDAVCQGLV